jgi:hypothetical protein
MEKMNSYWLKNALTLVLLAAGVFGAISCDDDDDKDRTSERSEAIENILEDGTWRVTYFFDSDMDETTDFESFIFTFNSDGSVQAVSPNDIIDGQWSTEASGDSGVKVNLSFPDDNDLFDDWHVVENSAIELELMHESGGSADTDYLTFNRVL